ncbi:hypothetical protein OIU84_028930 [Salix udensis]|uniref:Uncharacterized protein n=1 Tax=Salix udensis TaxID=889485 RepID=A0AAD6KF74_9ROSI|nr:hypothetical protein OIU84_028930 [Salix udensis]
MEFDVETLIEEEAEKLEAENCIEESGSRKGKAVDVENNVSSDEDVSRDDDAQFLSDKDFVVSDSDSVVSKHEIMSRYIASISDGFLSDKNFEDVFELDILKDIDGQTVESTDEDLESEYLNLQNLNSGYEADDFDDDDSDIMEELTKIEEAVQKPVLVEDTEMLSEKDFEDNNQQSNQKEHGSKDNEAKDILEGPESSSQDSEDSYGMETLLEHQDLIEQLKMELKKYEDRMSEIHKFYKSYREKIRKLDILSYQKMYAMTQPTFAVLLKSRDKDPLNLVILTFLQSKDSLQPIEGHEASAPASASLLPQKFLSSKRKKSSSDPMTNFVREYHNDLEVVYVGQLCLSWEILHWQYEKALELWDSDPYGMRQYNEVAVPVIREDSMKDKKGRRKGKDDDSITSDVLVQIMEESIRIFWRFVRSDKDSQNVISKGRKGTQVEPQDPTELELLTEVRTSFQKKERRLKDILRSGNCILRKFQKHREDNSNQALYFFSQVDMRLVARVLSMSRVTTDQLLWCHNKLSKINFVSRKIHVEPSFLLFPC